jgi:hypothetical protein
MVTNKEYNMFDLKALNAMSSDELRVLNKNIAFIVNERTRQACVKAAQMVTVGQRVKFAGKYGSTLAGTVIKVKVKMVEVDCGIQGKWNVAGSLLRAA